MIFTSSQYKHLYLAILLVISCSIIFSCGKKQDNPAPVQKSAPTQQAAPPSKRDCLPGRPVIPAKLISMRCRRVPTATTFWIREPTRYSASTSIRTRFRAAICAVIMLWRFSTTPVITGFTKPSAIRRRGSMSMMPAGIGTSRSSGSRVHLRRYSITRFSAGCIWFRRTRPISVISIPIR